MNREYERAAYRRGEIFGFDGNSYEVVDPRRKLERRDFELIREDHTAMANLPMKAQNHEFPKEVTMQDIFIKMKLY